MFLDSNAHLPLNKKALKAYIDFQNSEAGHGHPSSLSRPGRLASVSLEEARAKIASLIGAISPNQIVFTSNCTQAAEWGMEMFFRINNPFIGNRSGNLHKFFEPQSADIGCFSLEHPSVKQAFERASDKLKWDLIKVIPSTSGGVISDLNNYKLEKICCIHLQNEIGTIQPISKLKSDKCKYLFSDMSQSLGKIPVNVTDLDVDVAIFGGHKFGGTSLGFIYLKDSSYWKPFGTGSRYFTDRPGTPDVAGVVATAVALEEAIKTLPERSQKMTEFKSILEPGLKNLGFEVLGETEERCPNTTFVHIPNKAASLVLSLSEKGIHVGLGSACGSMHAGPSPLIVALNREGTAHDYMRISQFGEYGSKEAQIFLETLEQLL